MKTFFIIFAYLSVYLSVCSQNTYMGEIKEASIPCLSVPCLPAMVFALETTSGDYILTLDGQCVVSNRKLVVNGVEYYSGDKVEISGTETSKQDMNGNEFHELEILAIQKIISSDINFLNEDVTLSFDRGSRLYVKGFFVDRPLYLTVTDMHGKVVLTKGLTNDSFVDLQCLPQGLYIYLLLCDKRVVCRGKISVLGTKY